LVTTTAQPAPARDTYEAIFAAGAEEFAERGFEGAGVDRIAAGARVNKAMLYYHFGSKRGLYLEILRHMFRAVGARARAIAAADGPADQKTDAWIAALIEEAAARPWFPSIMLRELASGAPRFDPDTFALMNAVYGAVHDIIRQGQREGTFRAVDPLLTHLTVMPPILMFFARQRVLDRSVAGREGLAEPRGMEQFVRHMQEALRRILRNDS
jgi:AcrR family transcriptional regulator